MGLLSGAGSGEGAAPQPTAPARPESPRNPLRQRPARGSEGIPEPSAARVWALAGVLAGFAWPGRGRFERLPARLREAAAREAERVLRDLGAEG
jgi:hypothetical protein